MLSDVITERKMCIRDRYRMDRDRYRDRTQKRKIRITTGVGVESGASGTCHGYSGVYEGGSASGNGSRADDTGIAPGILPGIGGAVQMAEIIENGILIREVDVKGIMTKSSLPVGGYSVNPYVGCTHGCKYCYASFMKRFTGHTEPWGTFLDVKRWPCLLYTSRCVSETA